MSIRRSRTKWTRGYGRGLDLGIAETGETHPEVSNDSTLTCRSDVSSALVVVQLTIDILQSDNLGFTGSAAQLVVGI
jgi:hypothetical protein